MIEILPAQANGNAIATLAIGNSYFENWRKYLSNTWISYCKKNQLGLYVQSTSLDHDQSIKKLTWQKLLVPKSIKRNFPTVKNFCYLDSDIAINPMGENVFEYIYPDNLSLVSQVKNLPFDLKFAQKVVSFMRHNHYSEKYPLDSSIFMSPQEIFSWHGLKEFDDYACMGFFAGSIEAFADEFELIYKKYPSHVRTLTDGGDEPLLNFEFQSRYIINWLPYRFQAIWLFEVAAKYPFLYRKNTSSSVIKDCVNAAILNSCFLHFAGSWGESEHMKLGPFLDSQEFISLSKYVEVPVRGKPTGRILPN